MSMSVEGLMTAFIAPPTESARKSLACGLELLGSTSQPAASSWQDAEQQSPATLAPSSHCSAPTASTPSPHVDEHTLGSPAHT